MTFPKGKADTPFLTVIGEEQRLHASRMDAEMALHIADYYGEVWEWEDKEWYRIG